jgi:hypothetical protein
MRLTEGRTTPWICVTSPCWSFLKHERRAYIYFSSAAFNSSSKAFLCSYKTLWNSSTAFWDSSSNSFGFAMMMFLESISDKLPLPSDIVADESFFVPSGVAKKCVDAESGHSPKHLLMRRSQTSLADLRISHRSNRYRQSVRPIFYRSPQKSNELLPGRDPIGAGAPWCVLASARPARTSSITTGRRKNNKLRLEQNLG